MFGILLPHNLNRRAFFLVNLLRGVTTRNGGHMCRIKSQRNLRSLDLSKKYQVLLKLNPTKNHWLNKVNPKPTHMQKHLDFPPIFHNIVYWWEDRGHSGLYYNWRPHIKNIKTEYFILDLRFETKQIDLWAKGLRNYRKRQKNEEVFAF